MQLVTGTSSGKPLLCCDAAHDSIAAGTVGLPEVICFHPTGCDHSLRIGHRRCTWGPPYGRLAAATAKSLQSCPTLCDPIDGLLPGSSVPRILQNTGVGCHFLLQYGRLAGLHLIPLIPFAISLVQSLQSCPTLCDPMNRSTPGLPVHHHLPEFTRTHVHRVSDATQPSHPLSSPSPPAPNPSQHQGLFQ